jgi:hypothetical protein
MIKLIDKKSNTCYDKETVAAGEWLAYYLASAPLIEKDGRVTYLSVIGARDFGHKRMSPLFYSLDDLEVLEEKVRFLGKGQDKIEILRTNHILYYTAVVKTMKNMIRLATKQAKVYREKADRLQKEVNRLSFAANNENVSEKKSRLQKRRRLVEERAAAGNDAVGFSHTVFFTQSDIDSITNERFIKLLVSAYAGNGKKVRDTLKDVGYTDPLETALLIEKSVGRGRGNEYLYYGLATKTQVAAFLKEKYIQEKKKEEADKKYEALMKEQSRIQREENYLEIVQHLESRKKDREADRARLAEYEKKGVNPKHLKPLYDRLAAHEAEETEAIKFVEDQKKKQTITHF